MKRPHLKYVMQAIDISPALPSPTASENNCGTTTATWIGLFISLFGMLIVRHVVSFLWPSASLTSVICKESLIWACAAALFMVLRFGERSSLASIGIGTARWWKSLLWGLIIAVICGVVGMALAHITGYGNGAASSLFDRLPVWLITLIVIRAGIVEEFFYRGYAIERLQRVGLGRFTSTAIPLAIFALAHWTGGWANIVIALALGGVLSGFYLWRRDLVANMIGHGLVDFIANVLPRLFS
jgi:membrane protease YdiL (CAAX protease family)